jgi:hypothetical protein
MLSLVAQGLQRHEDNATSGWILEAVTLDFIPSDNFEMMHIDGAPECSHTVQNACDPPRPVFKGWSLDEWHVNTSNTREFSRRLGEGQCTRLSACLPTPYTPTYLAVHLTNHLPLHQVETCSCNTTVAVATPLLQVANSTHTWLSSTVCNTTTTLGYSPYC